MRIPKTCTDLKIVQKTETKVEENVLKLFVRNQIDFSVEMKEFA
jgi:hypothetical protein